MIHQEQGENLCSFYLNVYIEIIIKIRVY